MIAASRLELVVLKSSVVVSHKSDLGVLNEDGVSS